MGTDNRLQGWSSSFHAVRFSEAIRGRTRVAPWSLCVPVRFLAPKRNAVTVARPCNSYRAGLHHAHANCRRFRALRSAWILRSCAPPAAATRRRFTGVFQVFAFSPQGGVSVAKSKTDPKLGATRRHEAIDRCAQIPAAPRIASDNPDDDMHEHPTGWPDEFPLEPLPPHPGCDPIEVSTEPRPEHPDRRRSALRVARSREARPTR